MVAALVSSVVDLAARRTRQAARATAESETLGTLAGSVLRGETALPALLERVREAFGLTSVTLLERAPAADADRGAAARGPADEWTVVASAGAEPCERPQDADTEVPAGDTLMLALRGRPLLAEDQRVVGAFAAQAAVDPRAAPAQPRRPPRPVPLAEADRMRTALLAAVGHDLRTPLASAKAAVTSLRSSDVDWSPQDRDELLLTADESLDRLARLVDNLLDMSRLQAGALSVVSRPGRPRRGRPAGPGRPRRRAGRRSSSTCPTTCRTCWPTRACSSGSSPTWSANALRYTPAGQRRRVVTGSSLGDRVELRVIDRGPGIPPADLDRVFAPFQRLGDTDNTTGVGLGLALSRGLTEAMGGTARRRRRPPAAG